MILYFIPFERVGEFELSKPIDLYTSRYKFKYGSKDESNFESYALDDFGISLYVENGLINSINCHKELLYKGRNLIGMSIMEFMSHTDEKYVGDVDELDFEDDNTPQYVYEFEGIGLQVWVKSDIVITAIAFVEEE